MAYSFDGEIKLIGRKAIGRDPRGIPTYETRERVIPCKVESASQSEFFNAGQAGITPEHVFVINPIEYSKEMRLEFDGAPFRVYRVYRRSMDELELYAAGESGLNGN